MRRADEFILLDSVQYTRRDWRNRNTIKTPAGPQWITVPVEVKGRYRTAIDEMRVADPGFADKHVRAIELNYRKAKAFEQVAPWLFGLLREASRSPLLSTVNEQLLVAIARHLEIMTPIRRCTDLVKREAMNGMDPSERLLALCKAAGATNYLVWAKRTRISRRMALPGSRSPSQLDGLLELSRISAVVGAIRARGLDCGPGPQHRGGRTAVREPRTCSCFGAKACSGLTESDWVPKSLVSESRCWLEWSQSMPPASLLQPHRHGPVV